VVRRSTIQRAGAASHKSKEPTDIKAPVGSGSAALVAMMKPTDLRERDNPTLVGRLYEARFRAILFEREVGPGLMIILEVGQQEPPEVLFVQDDDVIEAFASNRADDPFGIGVLPRRARSAQNLDDLHCLQSGPEYGAIGGIAIADQIAWRGVPWKRLPDLLRGPFRGWVRGNAEVQDPAALML
jgi:hypothetical protein